MAKPITESGLASTKRWKRRVVRFTFGANASPQTVATWLQIIGACGIVRTVSDYERRYVVLIYRAGNLGYLEALLREGERREVLTRGSAVP